MKITENWRKEIQTIPNLLSLFRIILLPLYFYFVIKQSFYMAGLVIAISGVTDFLDGFIARHFDQVTSLGKVLDPVSDKLTQLVLIISMAIYQSWLWLLLGLFVVKELFMFIAGIIGLRKNIKLSGAKWYGKVSTAVIYVGMVILLLFPDLSTGWVSVILAAIAYGLLQSFVLYIVEYRRLLKEK